MEEERDKIHLHVTGDGENLIDFSSENDALVSDLSSPLSASGGGFSHHQTHHQSSEHQKEPTNSGSTLEAGKAEGFTPGNDQDEQLADPTESCEPERVGRVGKCNLRKSLAWDSAFFTSAGVLDPEELSSMIKGNVKSESQTLPGIQEDVRTSNDSISTLESDNLENLEAELFGDIRASIQKSSKALNMTSVNGKAAPGECQLNSSLRKLALASEDQVKQKAAFKKPISILKPQTKQIPGMKGPLKAVKQDSVHSQVKQPAVRNNSIVSLPKPPRVISKGQAMPTAAEKRASLGVTQQNKIENNQTRIAASRGPQASKGAIINGAHRLSPKPASSLKSCSHGSSKSTKTESTRSSLSDSCGSISSDRSGKSPVAAARRKVGDRTINPPPSGSMHKTPLKTAVKNRTTGNSTLSAHLMSSKISSSISPASSISDWSSVSSTSSSTIKQRSSKLRTSETSSCRSLDNENVPDLENHSNYQISDGHNSERVSFSDESTRESSKETGSLSQPGSVKPSGLRMPSPKIGFFDGVKSVRTPTGTMQSHATTAKVLSKSREAIRSPSMKTKVGKPPQAKTLSAGKGIKVAGKKSSSEERLHASGNLSSVSSDVTDSSSLSVEVQF